MAVYMVFYLTIKKNSVNIFLLLVFTPKKKKKLIPYDRLTVIICSTIALFAYISEGKIDSRSL